MTEEFDKVFVVIMTCVLVLEMVVGLVSNIGVLVISRDYSKKHWERGNNFNVNLHIVDSTICITIVPLTIAYMLTSRFQVAPVFCYVFEGAVSFASTASSLTLFFICLDRYYAVMAPTELYVISRRTDLFIICVWIFALFAFCSPFFGLKLDLLNSNNWTSYTCGDILWTMEPYYFYEIFYIITFLMTAFAMLMFYVSMKKVTRKRIAVKEALIRASFSVGVKVVSPRDSPGKTIRLSLAIVCAFLVFWGPHLVITIVTMFMRDSLTLDIIQIVCLTFAFMTTVIHPLLYAFLRQKFRDALNRRWKSEGATVGCVSYNADNKVTTIEIRGQGVPP